jgi:flagellar motor switch protein FliG
MSATAAASENEVKIIDDASKLTKIQKLAIFLLLLAPENAAQIVKHLEEEKLEAVTAAIAGFGMITREVQLHVVNELADVAMKGAISVTGGIDRARNILELGAGERKASSILGRISSEPVRLEATQALTDMDAAQIFNLIRNEEPQTIALVASYLTVGKTAQLLTLMRPEVREQVVVRLASISSTSPDAFAKVIEILQPKIGAQQSAAAVNKVGGISMVGKVLNSMDKVVSKSILMAIQERNAELGAAISQTMFGFEDLASLDVETLQAILREVDLRELTIALKAASERVQNVMLGCISKRAAENVREEMEALGSIKIREIEAAQASITNVAKRLEADGKIELDKGGGGGR